MTDKQREILKGLTVKEKEFMVGLIKRLNKEPGFSDVDIRDLYGEIASLRVIEGNLIQKGLITVDDEWKEKGFYTLFLSEDYYFLHEAWAEDRGIKFDDSLIKN